MGERRQRAMAGLAGVLALPFALAGCANPKSFEDTVVPAVIASDPVIEDAQLWTSSGLAGVDIHVRIYVTSLDDDDLRRAVESALKTALAASPERPVDVALDAAEAPKPLEPRLSSGARDLSDVYEELGYGQINTMVVGALPVLEERYGSWEELHGEWMERHR